MFDKQRQEAGDNAVNLQAGGDINVGLSIKDVKDIVDLVFKANFLYLQNAAREAAEERAEFILNRYLDKLIKENGDATEVVRDPDMQFAVFDAQKAFARSGDSNLGDVLVDILVRRTKEADRTTLQVVLNEALLAAPKLTAHQFDLLTLTWLMRYSRFNALSKVHLFQLWSQSLAPFITDLRLPDSSYSHLQYAGCGTVEITAASVNAILRNSYAELFSGAQVDPTIDATFAGFNAALRSVAEYWGASQAKHFTLTSVGIAIAHAHYRSKFPYNEIPLDIWIQ